jgi:hypothetical protein
MTAEPPARTFPATQGAWRPCWAGERRGLGVYVTMDAGPNVHCLCERRTRPGSRALPHCPRCGTILEARPAPGAHLKASHLGHPPVARHRHHRGTHPWPFIRAAPGSIFGWQTPVQRTRLGYDGVAGGVPRALSAWRRAALTPVAGGSVLEVGYCTRRPTRRDGPAGVGAYRPGRSPAKQLRGWPPPAPPGLTAALLGRGGLPIATEPWMPSAAPSPARTSLAHVLREARVPCASPTRVGPARREC